MRRALFVSIVFAIAASLPAGAQTTGTVRITLTWPDERFGLVAGVEVKLSGPALIGGPRTQRTNELGQAVFLGVSPGRDYKVEASLEGMTTVRGDVGRVLAGRERDLIGGLPGFRYDLCGVLNLTDRNVGAAHAMSLPEPEQPEHYICL